jgi:hypothetical protein
VQNSGESQTPAAARHTSVLSKKYGVWNSTWCCSVKSA